MRTRLLSPLVLGVIVLVVTQSPTFAQNTVVNACANNSTGVVRVVFGGNTCKPNESPLSWNVAGQPGPKGDQGIQGPPGPQGDPGDQNIIAIGVQGNGSTKSVNVPDLGDLEVACDAAGVAAMSIASPDGLEAREDSTTFNGQTQSAYLARGAANELSYSTVNDAFGRLVRIQISKAGIGTWMVDATLRKLLPGVGGGPGFSCATTASVTIMQ